jgi:uncharacterized protein
MHTTATLSELCREPEFARLVEILRGMGSAIIAYSGGVDSAFLLRVAHEVLGGNARGVLARSESLDRQELEDATRLAADLGIPITVVETHEYDNPEYRRNDGSRCYHCKTELFRHLRRFADEAGIPFVLDGSHTGDVGDHRPGLAARNEQGVRSPLMEAGMGKEAIRRFSRALGLPTWDKPAAPCLSSRIPYGQEVTSVKLRQVEAAEHALKRLGFRTVRVRHHGDVARIEVPAAQLPDLLDPSVLSRAVEGVKKAGFVFVTVDLEGFRSGSLNAVLPPSALVSFTPPAASMQGRATGSGTSVRLTE